MGKITVECTICNNHISKWQYEVNQIKDIKQYVCKKCKKIESKDSKICPVCKKKFSGYKRTLKKQTTCSYACSNKLFRTGENNGNWNPDSYRSTCFLYHKKECIICRENKIVTVHHYDNNHNNNDPKNLIPLCPTHHQYMHSKHKCEVVEKVDKYYKMFNV